MSVPPPYEPWQYRAPRVAGYQPPPAPDAPVPAPPPPPPAPAPRKSRALLLAVLFATLSVLTLCGVAVAVTPSGDEPADRRAGAVQPFASLPALGAVPDAEPIPLNTTPAAKPKPVLTEGTWAVGKATSVEAETLAIGTWRISTPEDGFNCYWARLANFDGELSSIIANGNVSPGKSFRVNVKSGDKGLELRGECEASK